MKSTGRRTALLALSSLLLSLSALLLVDPSPAAAAPTDPIDNPDLDKACGLDVLVILDESGSIQSSGATGDVRNAFNAFIDALANTGSSVAVEEFSTVARLPQIGANPAGEYITIDDTTVPDFRSYIANGYRPADRTNWEDATRVARYLAPRPNAAIPHLVVFITDGDPTAVIHNGRVTPDEYRSKVPLDGNETHSANGNGGLWPAIPNANAIKAAGTHILAIGVGSALQDSQSRDRLIQIAGPDVYEGTGTFDIATDDVYLEPDFANLAEALRNTAFQLCAPSVSIRKLVDNTPDPDSLDDAIPGTGVELQGTISDPQIGAFTWVLPAGAVDSSNTATADTNGSGFATFQWTPTDVTATSDFELRESAAIPGYAFSPVACTFRTPDTPDQNLPYTEIEESGEIVGIALDDIPPESIVTCQLANLAERDPEVTIEKYTNGVDADLAPGPYILVGDQVDWTYVVTNTGNLVLSDIAVTDDQGVAVLCPDDTLSSGESMTCTATDAAESGQYANLATVTATDSWGSPVAPATDPSHYFGAQPGITIEKSTVVSVTGSPISYDADAFVDSGGNVIAPLVEVGEPVSWTYEVTNTGGADLENVAVSDDQGLVVSLVDDGDGDAVLAINETWLYEAGPVAAVPGAYTNLGTVTADPVGGGAEVSDNDPSHYLGYELGLAIEKYVNGEDADNPNDTESPTLRSGDEVHFTYELANTGNYPLAPPGGGWSVTDTGDPSDGQPSPSVTCPSGPAILLPGESIVCSATATVVDTSAFTTPAGWYENVGSVSAIPYIPPVLSLPTGHPLIGETLTDTDPGHYRGIQSSIVIEKATNGDDADEPTGPFVPVGNPVTWSYVIENTGSATLTDIAAADLRAGTGGALLSCPETTLAPGASMICDPIVGTAAEGQFVNVAIVVGLDPFGDTVADFDPSHYFGSEPGVSIEKYTNGVDADLAPGAFIAEGDPVEWTYVITNTGNDDLSGVVVTDDQGVTVTCPQDTLAVGASMTCTAGGSAVLGQYSNVGSVTATDEVGAQVGDEDPSHYFGYFVAVDIEKATNGEDADIPSGPQVAVGDQVTWTYVVTNPGDVPLLGTAVSDDQGVTPVFQGGDVNGDDKLDPGETWTYEARAPAVLGQYQNNATVVADADFELGIEVTDSDPSHYLGVEAMIQVEKTPDLAEVPRGNPHTFEIEVVNNGTVDLADVVVTDPVTPSCDRSIGDLAVGDSVTYECGVDEVLEPIDNTAFVAGRDPRGGMVTDQDEARVVPVAVGGTALIGDTVWRDDDSNGRQGPGEPGIPGARVRIVSTALGVDQTLSTDADGRYALPALVAGTYEVSLDLATVNGRLTTPSSYLVNLAAGEQYLDADFGVVTGGLPFTGADTILFAQLGGVLMALGAGVLLIVRHGTRVVARLRS